MTHILDYIVSVNICLLVFFVFYYLFLAKEKFFKVNRFFLLAAVLMSFVIPSIDVEIQKEAILEAQVISKPILLAEKFIPKEVLEEKIITKPTIVQLGEPKEILIQLENKELLSQNIAETEELQTVILATEESLVQEEKTTNSTWDISLWQVLLGVYILGVILLSIRTLKDIFFLLRTGVNSKNSSKKGYRLVNTEGRLPTLSFFNFLFWDNSLELNKNQEEQIIKHELAHIKQWHTIDVLFMELLCILFWYNPTVYLFRKAIKEVHEYLADAAVLKSTCPNTYAKLLLGQVLGSPQLLLSNHFMQAQVKKRITMMTQRNSNRSILWKYLLVIPILAGMIVSFARLSEVPTDDTKTMQASLLSGELNSLENVFLFFNNSSELEKTKKERLEKKHIEELAKEEQEVNKLKEVSLKDVSVPSQTASLFYTQNEDYLHESGFNDIRVFYDSSDSKKSSRTVLWVKGGKEYELKFENDEITRLKVDGKKIAKKDYDKYLNIINKTKANDFVFAAGEDVGDFNINIDLTDEDGNTKIRTKTVSVGFHDDGDGKNGSHSSIRLSDFTNGDCDKGDKDEDCEHEHKVSDCNHNHDDDTSTLISFGDFGTKTKGKGTIFISTDEKKWEDFGEKMEEWGEQFAAKFEDGFDFVIVDDEDGKGKRVKKSKNRKYKSKTRTVRVDTKTNQNKMKFKVINADSETQREELETQREELETQREELEKQREELETQREELEKQREELREEKEN